MIGPNFNLSYISAQIERMEVAGTGVSGTSRCEVFKMIGDDRRAKL